MCEGKARGGTQEQLTALRLPPPQVRAEPPDEWPIEARAEGFDASRYGVGSPLAAAESAAPFDACSTAQFSIPAPPTCAGDAASLLCRRAAASGAWEQDMWAWGACAATRRVSSGGAASRHTWLVGGLRPLQSVTVRSRLTFREPALPEGGGGGGDGAADGGAAGVPHAKQTRWGAQVGPSLAGWPAPSVLAPPRSRALSSASFEVLPPSDPFPRCRAAAAAPVRWRVEVDDGASGEPEGRWRAVPATAHRGDGSTTGPLGGGGTTLELDVTLRCPPPRGCGFRLVPLNVEGVSTAGAAVRAVSARLPAPSGATAVWIELWLVETAALPVGAPSHPSGGSAALLARHACLAAELAAALRLLPAAPLLAECEADPASVAGVAASAGVRVLESRLRGTALVVELPRPAGAQALAAGLEAAVGGGWRADGSRSSREHRSVAVALLSGAIAPLLNASRGVLRCVAPGCSTDDAWAQMTPGVVALAARRSPDEQGFDCRHTQTVRQGCGRSPAQTFGRDIVQYWTQTVRTHAHARDGAPLRRVISRVHRSRRGGICGAPTRLPAAAPAPAPAPAIKRLWPGGAVASDGAAARRGGRTADGGGAVRFHGRRGEVPTATLVHIACIC